MNLIGRFFLVGSLGNIIAVILLHNMILVQSFQWEKAICKLFIPRNSIQEKCHKALKKP